MPVSANCVPVTLTAAQPVVLPLTGDLAAIGARKAPPPWRATPLTAGFLCILKDKQLEMPSHFSVFPLKMPLDPAVPMEAPRGGSKEQNSLSFLCDDSRGSTL